MKIHTSLPHWLSRITGLVAILCSLIPSPIGAQTDKPNPPAANTDAATKLPPPKEVIDRFVKAMGGKEAIARISSWKGKGKVEMPAQGLNGSVEIFKKRPNKLMVKSTIAGVGDTSTGFDGKVGWSANGLTGPSLMEGKQLAQTREEADFNEVLHDAGDFKSMETVALTQFDGKSCYQLKMVKKSDSEITEFYDAKSALLVGVIASQETPFGALVVTNVLSGYTKHGDVLFATKTTQKMGPIEMVMTIGSYELNGVADSVFDLPEPIKALLKK